MEKSLVGAASLVKVGMNSSEAFQIPAQSARTQTLGTLQADKGTPSRSATVSCGWQGSIATPTNHTPDLYEK